MIGPKMSEEFSVNIGQCEHGKSEAEVWRMIQMSANIWRRVEELMADRKYQGN